MHLTGTPGRRWSTWNKMFYAVFIVMIPPVCMGGTPYPASPVVADMTINWRTHQRHAQGSDNFQLTWADDSHQYGAWGDGGGFGGTNSDGRVRLGVARVERPRKRYTGYNVWGGKDSENPATFNGKSWGMICVNSTLYMWVVPDEPDYGGERDHYAYIQMARSTDYGRSWEKQENWRFTVSEKLTIPTFLNFGQNNSGSRDEYVYSYFTCPAPEKTFVDSLYVHKPGVIYLTRALPERMFDDKDAFEFFRGLDSAGNPLWGGITEKQPVFEDPNGVGWCFSVSYNHILRRYVLSTEHTVSKHGVMGVFDAPEPWGPGRRFAIMMKVNISANTRWLRMYFFCVFRPNGSAETGMNLPWSLQVRETGKTMIHLTPWRASLF